MRVIRGESGLLWAISGRGLMATKSKLEQAVDSQIERLNDAQRELVLSQFAIYKRNKQRIADIDSQMPLLEPKNAHSVNDVQLRQSQRTALAYERSQLATSNSRIATELFGLLSVGGK